MAKAKTDSSALTDSDLLRMLRERHTKTGNGGSGEYAFVVQVRNDVGFNSTRTFDAVTLGLWPSRGHELHAYEVKCSRNDWLRELGEPAKAEAAHAWTVEYCYGTLSASRPGTVRAVLDGEAKVNDLTSRVRWARQNLLDAAEALVPFLPAENSDG